MEYDDDRPSVFQLFDCVPIGWTQVRQTIADIYGIDDLDHLTMTCVDEEKHYYFFRIAGRMTVHYTEDTYDTVEVAVDDQYYFYYFNKVFKGGPTAKKLLHVFDTMKVHYPKVYAQFLTALTHQQY